MSSFPKSFRRASQELPGPAVLVLLVIWILHRTLFSSGRLLPVLPNADLSMVYLPWRYFGFSQWKHGHFPFWNPRVFAGIPFFAQIQSCLLYPIAWVNFLFNTGTAVVAEMAINLSIGAICTYIWARHRGISRCGATLAGAAFAFSGPFYEHVLVGYLTVLATLAWMPLVFLAMDRLLAEKFSSGILIGAAAILLQCLGGHAQLLYYTLLVGALYVFIQSIGRPRVVPLYLAFIAMCALGATLAAVQLLPGYFATQLSIRAGGTSYLFASSFSLAPENLLTILVPYPLGNIATVPYLGRWYSWEMTIYAGIVALVCACIGLASMDRSNRWRMIALLAAILVLTLGSYTPVYHLLYQFLPGFGMFRGNSKFGAIWTLMLAVLAGHGWDRIQRAQIPRRTVLVTFIGAALCAVIAALCFGLTFSHSLLVHLLNTVLRSGNYYVPKKLFFNHQIQQNMSAWLTQQWCIAAALVGVTCLLLYLRRFSAKPAYLLLVLAIADIYLAAADSNTFSPTQSPYPEQWKQAVIDAAAHDQRLLFNNMTYDNSGELLGYDSLWGYDTGQPKRYTELIAASQDQHPAAADEYYFDFKRVSPVFQLLRCRYILLWKAADPVIPVSDLMPRLQLIGNYIRMSDPTAIADRLIKDFDFRQSAILERQPNPPPTPAGTSGHATLLHQSINDMEIEADLPAPALLLITDAYAPGWHVRPIDTNHAQPHYEVLQADDVLRAIPLSAGHHHFDLYYVPPGFWAGLTVSMIGVILWGGGICWGIRV